MKPKVGQSAAVPQDEMEPDAMDSLLARLAEQQALQKSALSLAADPNKKDHDSKPNKDDSSASSSLVTPASGSFGHSSPTSDGEDTVKVDTAEMARLKKELETAKSQLARQKQELDQNRVIKHTFDQATGPSTDTVLSPRINANESTNAFMSSNRPFNQAQEQYHDIRSDSSDVAGAFDSIPNVWGNAPRPGMSSSLQPETGWIQPSSRVWGQKGVGNALPPSVLPPQQPVQTRNYSMPTSPVRGNSRGANDFTQYNQARGFGQGNTNRNTSFPPRVSAWEVYAGGPGPMDDMNLSGMTSSAAYPSLGMYPPAYQPRPIGTPLSPTAPEFRGGAGQAPVNVWNNAVGRSLNRSIT